MKCRVRGDVSTRSLDETVGLQDGGAVRIGGEGVGQGPLCGVRYAASAQAAFSSSECRQGR